MMLLKVVKNIKLLSVILLVFIFNFNYIVDCTIDSNNKTSLYLLIDATKLPMSYTQSHSYNNISYDFIKLNKFMNKF